MKNIEYYLQKNNLPEYLKESIKNFYQCVYNLNHNIPYTLYDCDIEDLKASINGAQYSKFITEEEANNMRRDFDLF